MSEKNDAASALMRDIPRGVANRRFSEQIAPQARFLNPQDVLSHPDLAYDPNNPGGKLMLGAIGDQLIGIDDNRHMLTVAGSRSGKSVSVIGNLFFYPGSVLCTDPKGELAQITAERRAKLGQRIFVLDPFEIVEGEAASYRASFNPISILTVDNPYIIEDALQITDALIISSGQEKDPHWNESASHFILGIILYVALCPELKESERNLITVRQIINVALHTEPRGETVIFTFEERAKRCAKQLESGGFGEYSSVMMGAITGFYDKGTEERGSVLSTVRRNTQFLDFRSMKSVLQGHDFNLADLKTADNGISVYLVLPATRMGSCNRWLRLFVNQLFDAMERERSQPKVPVLTVLDEFPVLGFMKQLQDAAGQIASFGVRLWVIMQDWGQGKALYGERFESFAANAGILQTFGNVDVTTTEYISKRLGQTMVQDTRTGSGADAIDVRGLIGEQDTRQHYPLMTPDEIARFFSRSDHLKRELIFWAGVHPMILQRVEYFDPKFSSKLKWSPAAHS